MRVLGIDPGTAATGYGIVEEREGSLHAVCFGAITPPASLPFAQRLLRIYRELRILLTDARPDCAAVEAVFFARNVQRPCGWVRRVAWSCWLWRRRGSVCTSTRPDRPTTDIPDELKIRNSALQRVVHDVSVSLSDADTSKPIHARVHVRDASGDYWPPQGHAKKIAEGWREDVGGDVIVDGKAYAYVSPRFTLQLPEGSYEIEVLRGTEYEPEHLAFTVSAGNVPALDISLRRWVHMASRGWYSGDTHTHFLSPRSARLEAEGEDLNVINVLLSSGGNYFSNIADFTGGPDPVSDDDTIVYVTEETRHDFLGHTVLLNLKQLLYPFGWGEPDTGVHGGYDHPTMAHQADEAHAQRGVVAGAHMPFPNGEGVLILAL